jgi:Methane oxygenase PmoA
MIRNIFLFVVCTMTSIAALNAQKTVTFEVAIPAAAKGLDIPVSADLDIVNLPFDSAWALYEVKGNSRIPIACQVERSEHRRLHFMVSPRDDRQGKRRYQLVMGGASPYPASPQPGSPAAQSFGEIIAHRDDSSLTFQNGDHNLLRYWFATVDPPAGVDSHFRRSGFIHPLWTPHGQSLTRIQPPDHRHHYGIWNPWTHVLFENDTVDFWNLGSKKGFVRFSKFISINNGPVYSEFKALHEHVVLKKAGGEKIAMNELQTVRVYRPADHDDYYYVDIISQLNCATQSPVLLLAYRYGGLGWRATEVWNKDNSQVITSEGNDRKTADGSKARWCIVEGSLDSIAPGRYGDYGGAVMLSAPGNYNHPEPLRIWPENSNNRGDLFANFDPTKDRDWLLEPGKTYTLRYRLVVFNGKFSKDQAESAWRNFAMPPQVTPQ